MEKKIGHYSFIVGVLLAILLGLVPASKLGDAAVWLTSLLVVLGLIVGFLNVTGKETKEFLIVETILVVVSSMGNAEASLTSVQKLGPYLSAIFTQIMAFVVPATVIVGLKDIWALGKSNL